LRLLLGGVAVVVGSPATDPVPDPALPHIGVLAWGHPAARLPAAILPPGLRPLIFLYAGIRPHHPVIDRTYPLTDAAAAVELVEEGEAPRARSSWWSSRRRRSRQPG